MERFRAVCTMVLSAVLLSGCSIQRAQMAAQARSSMIGLSKEQVLACMGVPAAQMAEGSTEVWTYETGNSRVSTFSSGQSTTSAMAQASGQATRMGNTVYGSAYGGGMATTNSYANSTTVRRSCTVSVVMAGDRVSRVNYSGPTGGLLTQGEQCAYAVENCAR